MDSDDKGEFGSCRHLHPHTISLVVLIGRGSTAATGMQRPVESPLGDKRGEVGEDTASTINQNSPSAPTTAHLPW